VSLRGTHVVSIVIRGSTNSDHTGAAKWRMVVVVP
jgi:hypothetical protein